MDDTEFERDELDDEDDDLCFLCLCVSRSWSSLSESLVLSPLELLLLLLLLLSLSSSSRSSAPSRLLDREGAAATTVGRTSTGKATGVREGACVWMWTMGVPIGCEATAAAAAAARVEDGSYASSHRDLRFGADDSADITGMG